MVYKCLKCNEIIPKTIYEGVSLVPKRYHNNGLCDKCFDGIKDNEGLKEYWEYRWIINMSKNNSNLDGFIESFKKRYNQLKNKFGDIRNL